MSPPQKPSVNDAQAPSRSPHRLSSAPSSSTHSRKSSSVHPTTSSASPPRTHLSSPAPIPIPWQNYRQQLAGRFSRDSSTSAPDINPARASDPIVLREEGAGSRRVDTPPRNTEPSGGIRRASYTAAIFRNLEGSMPNTDTEGQQWAPGNERGPTTATVPLHVSPGHNLGPGSTQAHNVSVPAGHSGPSSVLTTSSANSVRQQSRSRGPNNRSLGGHRLSNASPGSERSTQASEDGKSTESRKPPLGILGVCALDSKARSKPSRNILNRINAQSEFEVIIFGDKVILDEEPKNWPICDYLIAFFSEGFPLEKAIEYTRLRKPFSVNDLPMQVVLWDRRLCLYILDRFEVPTPQRLEITRDGGPRISSPDMARHIYERTGLKLSGPSDGTGGGAAPPHSVSMTDQDTLVVDGKALRKPFVEKPVSGEDHNIRIYYAGGGGRRLFRKINNKSSDADDSLYVPRAMTEPHGSYIYESFLGTQNNEDIKAYTVGSGFCHAETRKSPVVDGIVKRNTHGKEMRYMTSLSREETIMASRISEAFGQRICGFDLLRAGNKSYVIDVNGWSFVKDNNEYYDKCARILKDLFIEEGQRKEGRLINIDGDGTANATLSSRPSASHFQRMKSILKSPSVSRLSRRNTHGRHPKQSAHTSPEHFSQLGSLSAGPTLERPDRTSLAQSVRYDSDVSGMHSTPITSLEPLPPAVQLPIEPEKPVPLPEAKSQWKLKGMVAVIRHADRTPKQKLKFTFHTKPFIDLLKGHKEEVLLAGEPALSSVMRAARIALTEGIEDTERLKLLLNTMNKKAGLAGTKVQIKPMFKKPKDKSKNKKSAPMKTSSTPDDLTQSSHGARPRETTPELDETGDLEQVQRKGSVSGITMSREAAAEANLDFEKLQLIVKWGGEPTHSARYQSQELGENMRNDLLLMNRDAIDNVEVYSSSERRVTTSAQMWTSAFLDQNNISADSIQIRKDLLDDSNAAKDEMDKVKKKLKGLLRKGSKAPPQFAWPENMPEPYVVAQNVVELMKFHRMVMRENFKTLYGTSASSSLAAVVKSPPGTKSPKSGSIGSTASRQVNNTSSMTKTQMVNSIQNRWCSGEDVDLFKERWEKLFDEFCDPEKVDPSKISELHDTMKYDALHNRQFLEWVFTPSHDLLENFVHSEPKTPEIEIPPDGKSPSRSDTAKSKVLSTEKSSDAVPQADKPNLPHFIGFRKRSSVDPKVVSKTMSEVASESYFNIFSSSPPSKSKIDVRLEKLRELFLYAKVLFDFIGPQEYGILDNEKLEIGLLTSLPLLRAIVGDLQDMQASEGAKTTCYFTKESHIYTLLNCIIEGGIKTKIERNKIPELDYLSTICFELYESANKPQPSPSSPPSAEGATSGLSPSNSQEAKPKSPVVEDNTFNYSIRITISPGCHTFEPLDVQLDSRHTIGFAQRRSLTAHNDYRSVIETLRDKFHTVKLPKSFVAVNLSEKVPQAFSGPDGPQIDGQDEEDERSGGAKTGSPAQALLLSGDTENDGRGLGISDNFCEEPNELQEDHRV